jgi:hypothetical protein
VRSNRKGTNPSRTQLLEGVHHICGEGLWKTYLQHSNLLPIAKQPEGQWVLGVQARDHLAAAEWDRDNVSLQVSPVLVQNELAIFHAAPAFPPAAIGEHIQVACKKTMPDLSPQER